MGVTLTPLPGAYAVCRLPPDARFDLAEGSGGDLWSLTRTADELSIVCRVQDAPDGATVDAPWCALKLEGPFDLQGETGIIASVAAPLADAEISVFAMATYDTDYVLVPAARAGQARAALVAHGHTVTTPASTLRPARPQDAAALVRFVGEAFLAYGATFAPPGWEPPAMAGGPDGMAQALAAPGAQHVVAVDDAGRIVGVAALRATDEEDLGHVWMLFVDPALHGTGLAATLHDALCRAAREDGGLTRLRLYVADGATAAQAFYRRHGWASDGSDPIPGPGDLPVSLRIRNI